MVMLIKIVMIASLLMASISVYKKTYWFAVWNFGIFLALLAKLMSLGGM